MREDLEFEESSNAELDDVAPASPERRRLLTGAGVAAVSAAVGATIPFATNLPEGFVPAAFAAEGEVDGKDGLTVLNDRPLNAETPAHLLDDAITPTERHFIRNNGLPPEGADAASWTLEIGGRVDSPATYTIDGLKENFEVVTMALVIECGGNGRAFFDPPASGNQWTYRRRGLLGMDRGAAEATCWRRPSGGSGQRGLYTAHYGADAHLSGDDPDKLPISRGLPIAKALTDTVLIAFAMNGADAAPDERRAAAAGGAGLSRLLLSEMAQAHRPARGGA